MASGDRATSLNRAGVDGRGEPGHDDRAPVRADTPTASEATFIIRPVTQADTAEVLRLIRGLADYERLAHEVTVTQAELHAALFGSLPRIHAILAERGGAAVGLALYYFTFSTFRGRPNLFLEDLFVEPAARGAGIGLALMRHVAGIAVAEDCRRMEWRVLSWNQPSIDFYQRLGALPVDDWHTRQLGGEALVALTKGTTNG